MLLKVCELFRFRQIKKIEVYFGMYKPSFTFIEKIWSRSNFLQKMGSKFNFVHEGI